MEQPDDFGLELSTRTALHEMLLQKIVGEWIQNSPDPKERLEALEHSLVQSFSLEHFVSRELTPEGQEYVKLQSKYGQELARRFAQKIKRSVGI
ncbi:hypothetical protein [Delftia acidovorans]|uniref:hypothetical protein n=1 Tax=Delftia acidovorans TaxID=80866 RepID=UPI000F849B0B|nr:hypothetical protein [Delftia acidovorans]